MKYGCIVSGMGVAYIGLVVKIFKLVKGYWLIHDFPVDLIRKDCIKLISKEEYELMEPRNKKIMEYLVGIDNG